MSPRLLRDPQLPPEWSTFFRSLGYEVLEASATSPPALLAEAAEREAVLLTADPACELARCELRAPLPSLFVVPLDLLEGARLWLTHYADSWASGLIVRVRTAKSCGCESLAMLGHEGTTTVGEHALAWRAELRPPEPGSYFPCAAAHLVLRSAPWTGSALVLPTRSDTRPTPTELSLAARVGMAHGWVPGADLPDLCVPYWDWSGADHLHPCPCCDYRTLRSRSDYLCCPVCHWEDDGTHAAHLDDYAACNGRHLRRARSTFRRFGVYSRRAKRPPDALRTCYAYEPLGDWRRLRLMPTPELSPEWSEALAEIGTLVPGSPPGDPAATQSHARQEGAILVTSNPEHLARRWPSRYPSLVLVAADTAVATMARIKAHARDLRRGALLLREELIDLQGIHASGDVEVDGVVVSWTGELCVRDRPMVVVRVYNDEAPDGSTALVVDAAGQFATQRNGRPQIDGPALRRAIHRIRDTVSGFGG